MSKTVIFMGTVKPCESIDYIVQIMIPTDAKITAHFDYNPNGYFSIKRIYSQKIKVWDCNNLNPKEMIECLEANAPKLLGDGSKPVFVTKGSIVGIEITFFCSKCDLKMPYGEKSMGDKLVVEGDTWQEPEIYHVGVSIDCPTLPRHY
ncbi:hypothetical protein COO04_27230 [Bacillus toyonensis]|uniref:hypothetical protein n=1 Tax=Bacillus toyonensis TaxID=155322 RepID=UPI000BEC698C|nr:hypothetical protein [Bacillus toyonensis]PEG13114.1 hypothetical protein COO04_27230 [Bacillus toyonensis]